MLRKTWSLMSKGLFRANRNRQYLHRSPAVWMLLFAFFIYLITLVKAVPAYSLVKEQQELKTSDGVE